MFTFEGPGASNTKIPREDPQEREERLKIVVGEGKKSEILGGPVRAVRERERERFGARGPKQGVQSRWSGAELAWPDKKETWPEHNGELAKVELTKVELAKVEQAKVDLTKVELAKVEQAKVELAKVDLAKVGHSRGAATSMTALFHSD